MNKHEAWEKPFPTPRRLEGEKRVDIHIKNRIALLRYQSSLSFALAEEQ